MTADQSDNDAAVAFALVIGAGASTGLGAAVVFFPSLVKLASRRVLASSLGFSAGVMTYVSFVEIFQKANIAFNDALDDVGLAYAFATLSFFGGVLMMMLLSAAVAALLGGHKHDHAHGAASDSKDEEGNTQQHKPTTRKDVDSLGSMVDAPFVCTHEDPVNRLDTLQKMASVLEHEQEAGNEQNKSKAEVDADVDDDDDFMDNLPLKGGNVSKAEDPTAPDTAVVDQLPDLAPTSSGNDAKNEEENKRLVKMGLTTALAIGLHNFPEGLATFVAALHDPKVGSVLAIAIAIHNIPEGLCVALPIFYATGNRLRAFLWALLSGASEIVAALLGWAILANVFSDSAYAVLFGLVSGMMVVISIRELLPTAHFYDPEDTVVTYSFITGMAIMALSLVLFQL